jgi:hypothetical protein
VSTGETTDAVGRKIANVVNGVLKNDQTLLEKIFFPVMPGNVSPVNNTTTTTTTTTRDFNDAVQTLWPDGVKSDVLLLVTDASP